MKPPYQPALIALVMITGFIDCAEAAPKQHRLNVLTGSAGANSSQLYTDNTAVNSKAGAATLLAYNLFAGFKDEDALLYYEFLAAKTDLAAQWHAPNKTHKVTLETTHLQLGGTYEWQSANYFHPYVGMTFGQSLVKSALGPRDNFWSFSAAAGFTVPINEHFALRADGRAFLMQWDNDAALLCAVSETPCTINLNDTKWLHHQLTLGAAFRF